MALEYLCIDLKSFYASVECVARGLDPMTTPLVVADAERSNTTICLAVSPEMKRRGVRNRCRLFEVPPWIPCIIAPPRMQLYIDRAADVYGVFLKYLAPEDIHVYSIDEAFLYITPYLHLYGEDPVSLGNRIRGDVLRTLGLPAACGVGQNLYLAKVALDISAKHSADFLGVLTEESYRETLWHHGPLTDFWRVGPGTARHLLRLGLKDMADVAHAPEKLLYRHFGVDAEILIDHAWGREPVTMADIKAYKSREKSLSQGQVLPRDYRIEEAQVAIREMADQLGLQLTEKGLRTGQVSVWVSYARNCIEPAGGRTDLPFPTASGPALMDAAAAVFDRVADRDNMIRRLGVCCSRLSPADEVQLSMFVPADDPAEQLQQAVSALRNRYGRNSVVRGMDYLQGATTRERNTQIGGHRCGETG